MRYSYLFALFYFYVGSISAEAQKQQEINWKSWSELEEAIRNEPKPVFLFFEAEWCAYCKKIKREVFTKKQVIKKLNNNYYTLKMDVERQDTIYFDGVSFINEQARTQRNGIHQLPLLFASREAKTFSLPATVILDKQFEVVQRVFEYYTSEELMGFL